MSGPQASLWRPSGHQTASGAGLRQKDCPVREESLSHCPGMSAMLLDVVTRFSVTPIRFATSSAKKVSLCPGAPLCPAEKVSLCPGPPLCPGWPPEGSFFVRLLGPTVVGDGRAASSFFVSAADGRNSCSRDLLEASNCSARSGSRRAELDKLVDGP